MMQIDGISSLLQKLWARIGISLPIPRPAEEAALDKLPLRLLLVIEDQRTVHQKLYFDFCDELKEMLSGTIQTVRLESPAACHPFIQEMLREQKIDLAVCCRFKIGDLDQSPQGFFPGLLAEIEYETARSCKLQPPSPILISAISNEELGEEIGQVILSLATDLFLKTSTL